MCVLTCTCVDGGAITVKNITSYLGECVAAVVLASGVCVRVCVCAFVYVCAQLRMCAVCVFGVCGCGVYLCTCAVCMRLRTYMGEPTYWFTHNVMKQA